MTEITMNEFVDCTLAVMMLVYTVLAVWMITKCRNVFSGMLVSAVAIAGGYGLYQYAYYIALAVIWTVRMAAVLAVVAFVLGVYPGKRHCPETNQAND